MGVEVLRSIVNRLCNEWGAKERKFGFYNVADINKVRKFASEKWALKFGMSDALTDVINAVTAHQLDPYKKVEAERWLLGELMNVRELSHLNLMNDLREKKNSFMMLKVLIATPKKYNIIPITRNAKVLEFEKIKNNNPIIKNNSPVKITFFLPILSDNLPIKGSGKNCTTPPIVTIIPVINIELVRSNTNGWYTTLNMPTPKP